MTSYMLRFRMTRCGSSHGNHSDEAALDPHVLRSHLANVPADERDGYTPESAPGTEPGHPDRTSNALPADLIRRARKLNEKAVKDTGKPASIRALRTELKVGQDRARATRESVTVTA
jgi:hypothetical protein